MTQHERITEKFEDALFELLMDEFAVREGERLLAENECLKQDPDMTISDELDKQCIKTINRAFARKKRRDAKYAVYRIIRPVAVAVLVIVVLFGTAYAAFPEVRIRTLNLMIDLSDKAASLTMDSENKSMQNDDGLPSVLDEDGTLRGYCLPELPEGYAVGYETSTHRSAEISFINEQGTRIDFSVIVASGTVANRDLENAQNVEYVSIHDYSGILIEKDDSISLTWADTDQNNFVTIYCIGLDKSSVLDYAHEIEFVGIS